MVFQIEKMADKFIQEISFEVSETQLASLYDKYLNSLSVNERFHFVFYLNYISKEKIFFEGKKSIFFSLSIKFLLEMGKYSDALQMVIDFAVYVVKRRSRKLTDYFLNEYRELFRRHQVFHVMEIYQFFLVKDLHLSKNILKIAEKVEWDNISDSRLKLIMEEILVLNQQFPFEESLHETCAIIRISTQEKADLESILECLILYPQNPFFYSKLGELIQLKFRKESYDVFTVLTQKYFKKIKIHFKLLKEQFKSKSLLVKNENDTQIMNLNLFELMNNDNLPLNSVEEKKISHFIESNNESKQVVSIFQMENYREFLNYHLMSQQYDFVQKCIDDLLIKYSHINQDYVYLMGLKIQILEKIHNRNLAKEMAMKLLETDLLTPQFRFELNQKYNKKFKGF